MGLNTEHFVCYKCTREGEIRGKTRMSCLRIAHAIGWRSYDRGFVCSKCPGGGRKDHLLTLLQAETLEGKMERAIEEAACQR